MLPPELHEPFANGTERQQARRRLLERCHHLEEVARLLEVPADQWRPEQVTWLAVTAPADRACQARRLSRWQSRFADELRIMRDACAAAEGDRLSDAELRTAAYLAERLVASAQEHVRDHG